jgi:hypothetical protein
MVGTTRGVLCSLRLSSRAATSRDWTRMFNILRNDLSLRAGFRLSVARLSRTHQTRGKRWDVISDTLPQYTKEAKTRPLFSTLQTQFNGGERTLLTSINGRCRTSVGFNLNEGDRRPCGRGLTSCSAGGSGRHRARRRTACVKVQPGAGLIGFGTSPSSRCKRCKPPRSKRRRRASPLPAGDDVMNLQRLATMSADMCGLS